VEQLKLFNEDECDKDELQLASALFNANGNIFLVAKRLNIPVDDLTKRIKTNTKVHNGKKMGEKKITEQLRYASFEQLADLINGRRLINDGEEETIPAAIQLQAIKLALIELPKLKNEKILGKARVAELKRRGNDDNENPELEALLREAKDKIREGG
jgi:hypothetical protein